MNIGVSLTYAIVKAWKLGAIRAHFLDALLLLFSQFTFDMRKKCMLIFSLCGRYSHEVKPRELYSLRQSRSFIYV